jgi:glycosyltransferase involved in cell wall biosynthesis
MNKISIIIPSYNHYKFLKKRLDSIVNQTFKDWEMIIIDDQSNDGSIEILNDFVQENKNKVKHFIINETNSGSGYNSWKKGIELANSEYIWIAETDDYSDENFLEKSIQVLEKKPNCALSFCSSVYVDTDENHLYDSTKRTEQLNVLDGQFKVFNGSVLIDLLPFSTYITNGSSVVFRNTSSKIPDKIFTNKQSSDLFLWTYLLQEKSFIFLNEKLNFFRRHDDSTTTKTSKFNLESVYHEKANYLNYFEQSIKYKEFISHYIKFYINTNKSKMFNISSILKIENVKYLRLKYVKLLFKFYLTKIT